MDLNAWTEKANQYFHELKIKNEQEEQLKKQQNAILLQTQEVLHPTIQHSINENKGNDIKIKNIKGQLKDLTTLQNEYISLSTKKRREVYIKRHSKDFLALSAEDKKELFNIYEASFNI